MIEQDHVARLFAANIEAADLHALQHVAVANRGALQRQALRTQDTVPAPGWTSSWPPRRRRAACLAQPGWLPISAMIWSPSTVSPFSSTTIRRSASPSSAMPMSAPEDTTVSCSRPTMGGAAVLVDVLAVGIDPHRDHFRAQFPERRRGDLIGRAIGAIDGDLQAVETHFIGQRALDRVDVAAARVIDAAGAADIFGDRPVRYPAPALPRSPVRPHPTA